MAQFYDRHWKSLPNEVLLALLRTALPMLNLPLTPWQSELVVPPLTRVDNVFRVALAGTDCLLHIEYQSTLDPAMPERIWMYDTDLERQARHQVGHPLPILSVVVWTCSGQTPAPAYYRELQGLVLAHKQYIEINLTGIDWHHPADPILLVLAPYFQTVTPADLVPIAEQLYMNAPEEQRDFLMGALVSLGQHKFREMRDIVQLIEEKVGKAMDEFFEAISESPMGLALRERGKVEGKAEGKIEGEAEMRRYYLRRLWRNHFGQELDATLLDRIAALPQEQYDRIFDAVDGGTSTVEQVLALLDA